MKKLLIITLALLILLPFSFGQKFNKGSQDMSLWQYRKFEFSFGPGTSQFYGDIGGFSKGKNFIGLKDLTFKQTRINFTTAFKYKIQENLSVRLNLIFGSLFATDTRGTNELRGYESSTFIFEPDALLEYHFNIKTRKPNYFSEKGVTAKLMTYLSSLDYYVYGGLGAVSYSVKPNDALAAMNLQTKGFAATIPVGVGINFYFSKYLNIGAEYGIRYAFTDYLEGYTSHFSKSNDIYHLFNVVFTYKMKTGPKGWPRFGP